MNSKASKFDFLKNCFAYYVRQSLIFLYINHVKFEDLYEISKCSTTPINHFISTFFIIFHYKYIHIGSSLYF